MVELVRKAPPGSARGIEARYYVQGPATATSARESLARKGVEPDQLLVDFIAAFSGLRDQPLPRSGNFVPPSRWRTIESLYGPFWSEETESAARWKGDYIIYEALSGDKLLYGKSGRIGWYVSPESRYQRFWSGFKGFVRFYADFQDLFYPMDFYSTCDFLGRPR
jgi:hypothetical protein